MGFIRKYQLLTVPFLCSLLYSCGSSEKGPQSRTFSWPYRVISAQQGIIPKWVEEPQTWAKKFDQEDAPQHRYFTYNTGPKNSRSIACKIAQANAVAHIAGEITQWIKQSLGVGQEGDPTKMDEKLEEYVESTLAQEVQGFVVGAKVYRTYWEHRLYKKDLGADRDYRGFTCAALVKIQKINLERAIGRVQKKLESVANPQVKQNVKKSLEDAATRFNQLDSSL